MKHASPEEIRSRIPLSEIVGKRVTWDMRKSRPTAGDWWGCCPYHAEKSPSFHCDDTRGRFKCFGCGAEGDHFDFLMQTDGVQFIEAKKALGELAGVDRPELPRKKEQSEQQIRDRLNKLWRSGKPLSLDNPAGIYMNRRCGLTAFPTCLRYVREMVSYRDDGAVFHGLIARVTAADGKPATIHRTFLTGDGEKAPIDGVRQFMPGTITPGSAIRVCEHGDELGIAEGLETAVSATALHGVPCWSALNSKLLEQWTPPANVRRVVVFADNDRNFTGQAAAYAIGRRLMLAGLDVEVRLPEMVGTDWNDVWRERSPAHGLLGS